MKNVARVLLIGLLYLSLVISAPVTADDASRAAPTLINYQGVLNDSAGNPLPGTYDMIFRICSQPSGGGYDWQEVHDAAHAVTTDAGGVFNVILNSTGSASGDLANLLTTGSQLWLEIEVQGETLVPRQRLTSSGYALSAPWAGITGMPSDFSDGQDDIASAGTGLEQTGQIIGIEPSYQLPQNASNGQVAKWNSSTSEWEPGDDLSGGSYSAGDGLVLTGSTFSIHYAGSGSAITAARSDHTHLGQTWSGSSNPALSITTSAIGTGAVAIHGIATGDSANYGVFGESSSNADGAVGVYGLASGSAQTTGVKGEASSSNPNLKGVYGYIPGGGVHSAGVYGECNAASGYGVYGISSGAGSFGVYSQGDAMVDGDLEVTGDIINNVVQTGYASVSAAAFFPENEGIDYKNEGFSYERTNGGLLSNPDLEAIASIQLPHGATVVDVKVYGYSPNYIGPDGYIDFAFSMFRVPFNESPETMIAFTDENFPQVPGTAFIFDTQTISNSVIDNENYAYYFKTYSYLECRINAVRVKYNYIK